MRVRLICLDTLSRSVTGLLSLLVCLLLHPSSIAGLPHYEVDRWTTSDGLPGNFVKALCQTRDGYIWLTTEGGLVRFDGVKFKIFNSTNTPQLRSDRYTLFGLLEARDGALWAATLRDGLVRYHNGVFTVFDTSSGLPNNAVFRIDQDSDGNIWVFTYAGVARWQDGKFVKVSITPPGTAAIQNKTFSQTLILGPTRIYFGSWHIDQSGLYRFANGKWRRTPLPLSPVAYDPAQLRIRSLSVDPRETLWFGLKSQPQDFFAVSSDDKLETFRNLLPSSEYSICYKDRSGRLLVRSNQGQVGFWQNNEFAPIAGLTTFEYFRVLEDREGQLWIGTSNEGLVRIKASAVTLHKHPGTPQWNAGRILIRDRSGKAWFGAEAGLSSFENGSFRSYSLDLLPHYELPKIARTVFQDLDSSFWIGGMVGIVRLVDGVIKTDPHISTRIRAAVNAIHRDRQGNLWIASVAGLYKVPAGRPNQDLVLTNLNGSNVVSILEDREGTLWFACIKGLSRYTKSGFETFGPSSGLPPGQYVSLLEDKEGTIWAGTNESGIVRVSPTSSGKRFTRFSTQNGLYDNAAFTILEDNAGSFWVASRLGVYRVHKNELNEVANGSRRTVTSTHFSNEDFPTLNFAVPRGSPGGFRAPDGTLWFATLDGIATLDPGRIRPNTSAPMVHITDCLVDRIAADCLSPLQLGPSSPDLELSYTGLSFVRSSQIRFRYRLENFDTDWIDAGTRRTAYYPHLPPGKYRFLVKAANSEGIWSPDAATLDITVIPPFYKSWWFLSFAFASLAAGAFYLHNRRVTILRDSNDAHEHFSRLLIEFQEEERKRIAAELHDGIGQNLLIIKNHAVLGLMSQDMEPSIRTQFEEIVGSVAHSIDEVRQIASDLRPHHLDRLGLTQAIEAMIDRATRASSISFTTSVDNIDTCFSMQNQITVFRIVQESVTNILKHSSATAARVLIKKHSTSTSIVVSDNGQGFSPQDPKTLSDGGFGLHGIAERVRILGGELSLEANPGLGTNIRIQLPSKE